MALHNFKLPAPDSRLVIHNGVIYKLKLNYKYVKANAFLPCAPGVMQREVEAALRAVLHKDNHLKPLKIKTNHFLIDAKLELWPAAGKLMFEEHGTQVPAYPEKIVLTVQPRPGNRRSVAYQTLGLDKLNQTAQASLKRKFKEIESGAIDASVSATKRKHNNLELEKITPERAASSTDYRPSVPAHRTSQSKNQNFPTEPDTKTDIESDLSEDNADVFPETRSLSGATKRQVASKYQTDAKRRSAKFPDPVSVEESARQAFDVFNDSGSKIRPDPKNQMSPKPRRSGDTNISARKTAQDRGSETLKRTQSGKNSSWHNESTESELSDDEASQGSSEMESTRKTRERAHTTRYSFRNRQTEKKADQETKSGFDQHKKFRKEKSASKSVVKNQSRSQAVVQSRKVDRKCASTSPVDNDCGMRRSKRLKGLNENESTPAKTSYQDRDGISSSKVDNSVVSTGTQTQGSTFRIKTADMKLLKKLVVPLKKVDAQQSGQRPKRMLTSYPSTNETIGTRSTNREALCYQRDRTLIQQEELAEEMKLQQMALATSSSQVNKPVTRASKEVPTKRRSLIMSTLEGLLTPMKNIFK